MNWSSIYIMSLFFARYLCFVKDESSRAFCADNTKASSCRSLPLLSEDDVLKRLGNATDINETTTRHLKHEGRDIIDSATPFGSFLNRKRHDKNKKRRRNKRKKKLRSEKKRLKNKYKIWRRLENEIKKEGYNGDKTPLNESPGGPIGDSISNKFFLKRNDLPKSMNVNISDALSEFKFRRIHRRHPLERRKRWRYFDPHKGAPKIIVRTHNNLRGRVNPPAANMLAMSWSSEAAEQAQFWADECKMDNDLDHPSVRWTPTYGTCGQNVLVTIKKKRWGRVLRLWWNEHKSFYFGNHHNNETRVSRYSQMVWYSSHKVGCGFSTCRTQSKRVFYRYVCNYCPGENDPIRLSKPYVEGKPCEQCPNACKSLCSKGGCKLCTNYCPFANLWANCEELSQNWNKWLCNTKTRDGVRRFKNCRATCQCHDKIT